MGVANRYLLKRVLGPLLAVTVVVSSVVSLWQLARVGQVVLLSWRDVALLGGLILDLAPGFSGMALGTAGVFGCVVAYDRLAEDGELTALAACAVGPWRIYGPAWAGGLCLALAVAAAGIWGEPWGASRYPRDVALLGTRSFAQTLKEGTFNQVGNLASVYVGKAMVSPTGEAVLQDVVVGRDLPNGPVVITAAHVTVRPQGPGLLALETGGGEAVLPGPRRDVVHRMRFEHAALTVDVASWLNASTMHMYDWQAWEFPRLWAETGEGRGSQDLGKLRFHLWQKLALPFGMLALSVVGGVLGGQRGPAARSRAYLACALLVAIYFGVMGFGRNLVIQGSLPAWLGANLGNGLLAVLWAWLWRTRATRWG